MLKKKSFYIIILILGIVLIGISFIFEDVEFKTYFGILFGVGSGLVGSSIAKLAMKRAEQKNPQWLKQNEIEFKDERSTMIRSRAKAKAGDIIQWFIMGIAYLMIIINAPLWLILITVGVYALYNILAYYFISKYQKEM